MYSISYVHISWTIHGMWMIYITFETGCPKFSNTATTASVDSKMVTMQHKNFLGKNILCPQLTLLYGCALGERSSGGIWKVMISSFKCCVYHSHTTYSSRNIDVRNWGHLYESLCISNAEFTRKNFLSKFLKDTLKH